MVCKLKNWICSYINWWHEPRLKMLTRWRIAILRRLGFKITAKNLHNRALIALFANNLRVDDFNAIEDVGPRISLHGYLNYGRTSIQDASDSFEYQPLDEHSLTVFMSPQRADQNLLKGQLVCVVETSGLSGGFYQPPNGRSYQENALPQQ